MELSKRSCAVYCLSVEEEMANSIVSHVTHCDALASWVDELWRQASGQTFHWSKLIP